MSPDARAWLRRSSRPIVWIIALGGMTLFRGVNGSDCGTNFQLASGLLIVALSGWSARAERSDMVDRHE